MVIMLSVITQNTSVVILSIVRLNVVMLTMVILNVFMLIDIALVVVMLSVVAPIEGPRLWLIVILYYYKG